MTKKQQEELTIMYEEGIAYDQMARALNKATPLPSDDEEFSKGFVYHYVAYSSFTGNYYEGERKVGRLRGEIGRTLHNVNTYSEVIGYGKKFSLTKLINLAKGRL